jgi:hypothetical protein
MMQCTSGSSPTISQYIVRSTSLTVRSNVIEAICAPCVASSLVFNISFGTENDQSSLQINNLTIDSNNITIAPPAALDSTLFNDPNSNVFFTSANQVMFCLPPAHSTPYVCNNPLILFGYSKPTANMVITGTSTSYVFPTSWSITPSFNPNTATFPAYFGDTSFPMSVVFAANLSFPNVLTNSETEIYLNENTFNWGPVTRGSNGWGQYLAGSYITTVFTAGLAAVDMTSPMTLEYDYLLIDVCDTQDTLLGLPIGQLLTAVGLKYVDKCPPTTTTTTTTSTTTTSTTTTPTTTTSTIDPTQQTTNTVPPPSTSTATPSGNPDNNKGEPAAPSKGLSPGAAAGVSIVVIIVVAVIVVLAFLKRNSIKKWLGIGSSGDSGAFHDGDHSSGTRRQAFRESGYGAIGDSGELESRRMSVASAQEV